MPKPQKLPAFEPKIGNVADRSIVEEMNESYLDYAMSVIVSRALPDVRDGMKPVHRRILYSMWQSGLRANAKFKKCATVVGDVLGKYHPHGDLAVYDSLVRMAQDFSLRHPLVNGQGNFGSMDGDSAAAYRYTEAKLSAIAEELLFDIEKDTVDFQPTYDDSHKEPKVLPAKFPNLLLNGTVGIAVGMATNIPPHNLGELCDGVLHLLENPEATVEELFAFVKGPDFPTGGIIYDKKGILQMYATGRGGVVTRAKTEIVEDKRGISIIVSEIPFQVNKATLIEHIADLVREKKIEGIRDLRDESSKDGVRVVVELKREAYPKKVLNRLFMSTDLQTTFHMNMLALVDGIQPRVLNLKSVLEEFVKHREVVIRRRTAYDLARAKERAHILEGLMIALANIDKVIEVIKKSKDKDEARLNLIKRFKLSEVQAVAILEMRLQNLANLERIKIEIELKEKLDLVKALESILASVKKIRGVIKQEIVAIRDKFANARRTQIVPHGVKDFSVEDIIPNEPTLVLITHDGYVKRLPPDTFKTQGRGGKGVVGVTTKEEDVVEQMFATSTHADLLFFTTRGRVFQLKAYEIPVASRTAKGQALVNFLQLAPNEKVSAALQTEKGDGYAFLVMATKNGVIKKTEIKEFENVRRNGLIAIKIKEDDTLQWVKPSLGSDEVAMVTAEGQSIRFSEKSVRSMGRSAAGVRGIKLKKRGDRVVSMDVLPAGLLKKKMLELFVVAENGMGKRTNVDEYKAQGRGGSGIKTMNVNAKTGAIVGAYIVNAAEERDLMIISQKGQMIRIPFGSIKVQGRTTQGIRIMRFKEEGDAVASTTLV